MDFGELRTNVLDELRDTSLSSKVPRWFNAVQNWIAKKSRWRHLQDTFMVPLTATYSTGTVTVTNGSTTVTGSGTSWTSAMVGQLIQIGASTSDSAQHYYRISAVGGATAITLESNFVGDTASAQAYTIYFQQVTLPSDISQPRLTIATIQEGRSQHYRLTYISEDQLFDTVPNEVYQSRRPTHFRIWEASKIQLWPPPTAAANCQIFYYKYPTQISLTAPTGNEVLSWPLEMHYTVQKLTEAEGWKFLDDTKYAALRSEGLQELADHIKENNRTPEGSIGMRRWDDNSSTYPSPIFYPNELG